MARGTVAEILAAELRRRQNTKGSRFSLRAFALQLGVDSATLSQIISGRRRPSSRLAERLLRSMGSAECDVNEVSRAMKLLSIERRLVRQIARNGILPNSKRFARRLRLPVDAVNSALAELLRDRRVRMASRERWIVHDVE